MASDGVVTEWAPAKVNLFLHVVGRRADGYHLLDSLAVFAAVADRVEARPAASLSLAVQGAGAAALQAADQAENLVLRAARALAEGVAGADHEGEPGLGARLVLEKMLPVASGIGGGSADAAATLRALSRLWGRRVPAGLAAGLAVSLGADVPVCLGSQPARMGGIGEHVLPAPALPAFGLLLVNPGVAVSTPAVFRARDAGFSAPAVLPSGWADAAVMASDLAAFGNDLEAPARRLCPPIEAVLTALRQLPGCLLARMSGSGATCFGLFASAAAAARAAAVLAPPPEWWVWAGGPHVARAAPGDQAKDTAPAPEIVAAA